MADIMGSGGLAWYQWKKHGRCSGLAAADYFARPRARLRGAGAAAVRAAAHDRADGVEEALLAANPALDPDGLVVTCRDGRIAEARLCLDRGPRAARLRRRTCSRDACRARGPLEMPPVR